MKKLLILVIGIVCMTVFLSGCKRDGPNLNNPRDEESYYEYGFMEMCSNGNNYFLIKSMEISSAYTEDNETNISRDCYAIFGVETNLSESDFRNSSNMVELRLSSNKVYKLNFLMLDLKNEKLVYEVLSEDSFDISQLYNLKISNSDKTEEYPFLGIFLDCFNVYCTIDGIQYCGRCTLLNLE